MPFHVSHARRAGVDVHEISLPIVQRLYAGQLLPRHFAIVYGLRDPIPIFQYHCYAGRRQHGRDRPDDRRSDYDDLDL